jgi:3-phenylpropionate/cinnamic acid dioxygenase small subunit
LTWKRAAAAIQCAFAISSRHPWEYAGGCWAFLADFSARQPQILNKYVVLKNDYIHQVIDIYHV